MEGVARCSRRRRCTYSGEAEVPHAWRGSANSTVLDITT